MMKFSSISIDLAKHVFQVAEFNIHHKRERNKLLGRAKFIEFICNTPLCSVEMEACYSSQY